MPPKRSRKRVKPTLVMHPPLLDLPVDVLLLIYEAVLVRPSHLYPARSILLNPDYHPRLLQNSVRTIAEVSNFLSCCRQIHEDGSRIFYSQNVFYIMRRDFEAFSQWPEKYRSILDMAPNYAGLVQHIGLVRHVIFQEEADVYDYTMDWCWRLVSWNQALQKFTNLRTVKVELAWSRECVANFEAWLAQSEKEDIIAKLVKMLKTMQKVQERKVPKDLKVEVCLVRRSDRDWKPPNLGDLDIVDTAVRVLTKNTKRGP